MRVTRYCVLPFCKLKQKVAERVAKQAVNVMDLYRKRARIEREPCRPDGPEMDEFAKGFKHQLTVDQVRE